MLPQFGGGEHLLVVAIIALLVIGPKDLPKVLRELGRWAGKVRAMANEFKSSFEDMARQSELDELRAQVEAMRTANPLSEAQAALEASRVEVDAMVNGEIPYQPDARPPADPEPVKPKGVRRAKPSQAPAAAGSDAAKPASRRKAPAKAKP